MPTRSRCGLLLFTGAMGFLVLPYQAFLPAFARDVLFTGADGLALLVTAVGAGAVLGALLSNGRLVEARPNAAMAAFALATGAGLAAFAVATPANGLPPWLAPPALCVVGLGSIGYLTTANSILQLRVPTRWWVA